MSNAYIDGFIKRAQAVGLSKEQATNFLKVALDPSQAGLANAGAPDPSMGGGMGGQGGPPPPPGGGDPTGGAPGGLPPDGSMGVPPEIEQLIQQLPPEVLQQLLQEIEGELGGGAGGPPGGGDPSQGAGGPPPGMDPSQGAGGPPPGMDPSQGGGMPPKQGSEKILAKEAKYIEGFVERALGYGFDKNAAKDMYKKALQIMEGDKNAEPAPVKEKRAAHYDGFMSQAKTRGIVENEAAQAYHRIFGK